MRFRLHILYFILGSMFLVASLFSGGCAQIGLPTGGVKDTIAPKLVKVNPALGSRNITSNKITFEFDEYIDLQELQQNLLISPLQKRNPSITANPKTITLKFRDTLLPNTTYTINFGKAIRDINEGNVLNDLSYIFSTGNVIDSSTISGNVILAETGNVDSTLIVMLYKSTTDSIVKKTKPNYIARVDKEGNFSFKNLPATNFKIYALKDGDGGKTYNSLSETFAFADKEISAANNESINLYAYAEEKEKLKSGGLPSLKKAADKKLKISTNLASKQDLLKPIEISFNNPLKTIDNSKIYLVDTFFKKITDVKYSFDSTATKIFLSSKWTADMPLILIIDTAAVKDSVDNRLSKNDTIKFSTKRIEDYGKLILHFNNLDFAKSPVLQFVSGDDVKYSYPIVAKDWINNLFVPGEYEIRILYDANKDGKWTPGSYEKKVQPEMAVTLPQKLSVRADWENEREINF
jgi:Bacterial Ig-like domain